MPFPVEFPIRLPSRATEGAKELHINRLVLEHGRMQFLSDPVPPWHYRGWLLLRIQMRTIIHVRPIAGPFTCARSKPATCTRNRVYRLRSNSSRYYTY